MARVNIHELRFDPPPMCDRAGCCDLACVWPTEAEPQLWEGQD